MSACEVLINSACILARAKEFKQYTNLGDGGTIKAILGSSQTQIDFVS